MKSFLALCATWIVSSAWSMEPGEFLKLEDSKKIEYLHQETHEITDEKAVAAFMQAHAAFAKAAEKSGLDVSNVWSNTILEGPYSTEGEPEIAWTSIFVQGGEFFGAMGVVRQNGVFTESDDCSYDDESDSWSEDCSRGTISEAFYVDFEGEFIASDEYADFND